MRRAIRAEIRYKCSQSAIEDRHIAALLITIECHFRPWVAIVDDRLDVESIRERCVLTDRQAAVLDVWLRGWNRIEIASQLGLTKHQVRTAYESAVARLKAR